MLQLRNGRGLALLLALAASLLGMSSCAQVSKAQGGEQESHAGQEGDQAMHDTEELYISRGGNEIYGILFRPKIREREKLPLVILSHGYNDSSWRSLTYAAAIAEKGFAAFCFDFCGGSSASRSTGSSLDMSIFTEQADLEAVIAEMKALDFVDGDSIFLIGASQGGAVSALVAGAHPEDVRGMALIYPAFVIPDDAREAFASVDEVPDSFVFMGLEIGKAYYEGLFGFDIYAAIEPYKGNVLIVHGDADTLVPISYSERALDVYASAELKVIRGAGHGFSDSEARQAIEWILEYLQREIGQG